MNQDFEVRVFHSVQEIDPLTWEKSGNGTAFSSHAWYSFGEAVMKDCEPVHILLNHGGRPAARATFWEIRNEPLPISSTPLRKLVQFILKRRPLFICRSPLANTSGLTLPEGRLRQPALDEIIRVAELEATKCKASFLVFDYLSEDDCHVNHWPRNSSVFSFSDPGTRMKIVWSDFDQYLAGLKPKVRKHYRQYQREAEGARITIVQQKEVPDLKAAVTLIRNVEQRHHSAPNPWIENLLQNAPQIGGTWLTACQGDRMIGCELLLVDNDTQMVTALGMAEDFPHVYFLLGYADIQLAIEEKRAFVSWGSGAFEAKQRLGFQLESDNQVIFAGITPFFRIISGLGARIGS